MLSAAVTIALLLFADAPAVARNPAMVMGDADVESRKAEAARMAKAPGVRREGDALILDRLIGPALRFEDVGDCDNDIENCRRHQFLGIVSLAGSPRRVVMHWNQTGVVDAYGPSGEALTFEGFPQPSPDGQFVADDGGFRHLDARPLRVWRLENGKQHLVAENLPVEYPRFLKWLSNDHFTVEAEGGVYEIARTTTGDWIARRSRR